MSLTERYIESYSLPTVEPQPGSAVIEVAPDLSEKSRRRLRQELSALGLTLAKERPAGFPQAREDQQLIQSVWAMAYDSTGSFAGVRQRLLEWRRMPGDSAIKSGILGILPGFVNRGDRTPLFFRPAHISVMLTNNMPRRRIADSLAGIPGLTAADDSLERAPVYKYIFRQALLRVAPEVGVFAALDSLHGRQWIRAAGPVSLTWGNNLPFYPPQPAMEELAVGSLRKISHLFLAAAAHIYEIDGLEAAQEMASTPLDSLGRLHVEIGAVGTYEEIERELVALDFEAVSFGEYPVAGSSNRVIFFGWLPCRSLRGCADLKSVVSIGPYSGPVIDLN